MTRVIVNGTFDIVHTGHIKLLNYAKSLGDYLLVCIDTDARVQQLKGKTRPINTQKDRALLLQNLKAVDEVLLFDSDQDLEDICKKYSPDIMVKGGDYKDKPYVGQTYCKNTVYYDRIEPYSTTSAIQHIATRR